MSKIPLMHSIVRVRPGPGLQGHVNSFFIMEETGAREMIFPLRSQSLLTTEPKEDFMCEIGEQGPEHQEEFDLNSYPARQYQCNPGHISSSGKIRNNDSCLF